MVAESVPFSCRNGHIPLSRRPPCPGGVGWRGRQPYSGCWAQLPSLYIGSRFSGVKPFFALLALFLFQLRWPRQLRALDRPLGGHSVA